MKKGSHSGPKLPLQRKYGDTMVKRFGKGSIPRKAFQKAMYVENALLRESRKLSQAKNKYTTNMIDNVSAAEKFVKSIKSKEEMKAKEHKLGILTPLATTRFEHTGFSTPDRIDPRLKTISAAGMTTNSELQLINKEKGDARFLFMSTEMKRPNMRLLHTMDPNNKTLKAIQNITQNLNKLNDHSKSNWSHRDLSKKLLSAPSNVSRNYDKNVNKEFNENLTITHMKSENRYDDIQNGSPVRRDQRLARLRKQYGFVNRNGKEVQTFSDLQVSADFKPKPVTGSKLLECMTSRLINEDQKINYFLLKDGKHK